MNLFRCFRWTYVRCYLMAKKTMYIKVNIVSKLIIYIKPGKKDEKWLNVIEILTSVKLLMTQLRKSFFLNFKFIEDGKFPIIETLCLDSPSICNIAIHWNLFTVHSIYFPLLKKWFIVIFQGQQVLLKATLEKDLYFFLPLNQCQKCLL